MSRRRPAKRWRRGLWYLLAVAAAFTVAVLVVRSLRDYERVPERPFFDAPEPMIFAHRGASARELENTQSAFDEALRVGADVLELDLRLTGDGVPVVAHDADLDRALGVPLTIADNTLAELREALSRTDIDRDPGALLLTFEDALRRYDGARLNAELKDDDDALAESVAALIDRFEAHDRVLVASFHGSALRAFRDAAGGRVATSAATGEAVRFYACFVVRMPCRPDFEALQIPPSAGKGPMTLDLTSRRFLTFARRHGLAVHYWTVDDPDEIERLFALGADGVMTNTPERAIEARTRALAAPPNH